MKTIWFKELTEEQISSVKKEFLSSPILRDKAIAIMKERITNSNKQRTKEGGYESPNWAFMQADSCGYERAYLEMINTFSI